MACRSCARLTTRGALHEVSVLPAHVAHFAHLRIEEVPPGLSKFLICPMPGLPVALHVDEGRLVPLDHERSRSQQHTEGVQLEALRSCERERCFLRGSTDFKKRMGQAGLCTAIADAPRTELGNGHRATKTLMRRTGAGNRTPKNWLSGCGGLTGHHLLHLARGSDTVLATLLGFAGRHQHGGADLLTIRRSLISAILLAEESRSIG
jgi:hypothetical protein